MTDPYRSLCAELAKEVEHLWSIVRDDNNEPHPLANRARALLAEPVAEGPTDEELLRVAANALGYLSTSPWDFESVPMSADDVLTIARAALARWGRPAAAPVPEPQAEGPTIPSRYRGHEIAVYRDGFHAGYKEALAIAAEPEAEGPSADELIGLALGREPWATWLRSGGCLESAHCELVDLMLAAIARWGRQAAEPAPVSERPWERQGWCDKDGRCWFGWADEPDASWSFCKPSERDTATVSLPAHALPTPRPQ